MRWAIGSALAVCFFLPGKTVEAVQQIAISTPFTTVSDSYYERTGISFGGRFGAPPVNGSGSYGFFSVGGFGGPAFGQGGFGTAIPPFGGYDPNSGARFGFDRFHPDGSGFGFRMELAKGNSRTLSSQAPSLVVQNGFGGSIFDGRVSPFVTGVIPVLGSGNPEVIDNGVTRALSSGQLNLSNLGDSGPTDGVDRGNSPGTVSGSTASRGDRSVSAIRRDQEIAKAEVAARIQVYLAKADEYAATGELGQARLQLKRALSFEKDPGRRSVLIQKLNDLGK